MKMRLKPDELRTVVVRERAGGVSKHIYDLSDFSMRLSIFVPYLPYCSYSELLKSQLQILSKALAKRIS